MKACDPNGPLLVHVVKLYSALDGATFHALARVYSGTLKKGNRVRVLGEAYTLDDEEDAADRDVLGLALPEVCMYVCVWLEGVFVIVLVFIY